MIQVVIFSVVYILWAYFSKKSMDLAQGGVRVLLIRSGMICGVLVTLLAVFVAYDFC
jgi:hypothetical protein